MHERTASRASFATESANNIKVIARFRPENELEKADESAQSIVQFVSENTCRIDAKDFTGTFTFDRVFGRDSRQEDVFEFSLRPTVEDILNGYNGTVLAYGQTGSGKSYTMMGPSIDDVASRGAIPRIVDQIFGMIRASPPDIEYTVRVSYMEIYMERIKDLLCPSNDNLPIHEDKTRGVYVKGLTEEYVASASEVYQVMRQGSRIRSVASTNMNQESSRSHSIFVIVVAQKNLSTGSQKTGQLFLVDLAGSEKVGKTGASGQTLEEAKKINKSLSSLGNVINALTDSKSSHIPYRDSKLTRILQESLGGNSRTSLIVNCSPSSFNDAETISTLRFGVRAKTIQNKAKINAELSPTELRQLLRSCQTRLENRIVYSQKLESELLLWRTNNPPAKGDWLEFETSGTSTQSAPSSPRSGSSMSFRSNSTMTPLRKATTASNRWSVSTFPSEASSLEKDSSFIPTSPIPHEQLDVIDEYIKNENALQDQLTEKENIIARQEILLAELRAEDGRQIRLDYEKLMFEHKELEIQVSGLVEDKASMARRLETAKQELLEARMPPSSPSSPASPLSPVLPNSKMGDVQGRQRSIESEIAPEMKSLELGQSKQVSSHSRQNSDLVAQLMDKINSLTKTNEALQVQLRTKKSEPDVDLQAIGDASADMKSSLMAVVQERCDRIVELEIKLDEARDENADLRSRNSRQHQKKVVLLQRNLEQLTHVQRQMMDQNSQLKTELAVVQQLLTARNDRIHALEESQRVSEALLAEERDAFAKNLTILGDHIADARSNSTTSQDSAPGRKKSAIEGLGLNIIKPIRGGGDKSEGSLWTRLNSYVNS